MTIPNPLRDAEVDAWDTALLANIPNPGLVVVSGATSPRKWDEAAGTGTSGATLRWTGDGLPEFEARVSVWTPEQFEEWDRTWGPLTARTEPGQKPLAFDWRHPATDDLKIRSVVVLDLTQWEQVEDGLWQRTVKLKQYRKPAPALGKPAAAAANEAGESKPTPKDDQDRIIQDLDKRVEIVAGGGNDPGSTVGEDPWWMF